MSPDGRFPTVENNKPNPEERVANDLAVALMMSSEAAISPLRMTPMLIVLAWSFAKARSRSICRAISQRRLQPNLRFQKLSAQGTLSNKHFVAKTIVTTDFLNAIAERYDVTVYGDMLIGFKYIGELLLQKEGMDEKFVIGGEESYGLLKGDYARDKDGAVGALVLAEYAAELKASGKTLYDRLLEMYGEYGIYSERLDNIVCPGAKGFEQMQAIMTMLRSLSLQRRSAATRSLPYLIILDTTAPRR